MLVCPIPCPCALCLFCDLFLSVQLSPIDEWRVVRTGLEDSPANDGALRACSLRAFELLLLCGVCQRAANLPPLIHHLVSQDVADDDDDDDDGGDYSDDDDLSWKVRRAATKFLSTAIQTRPDRLAYFYDTVSTVLLSRFKGSCPIDCRALRH